MWAKNLKIKPILFLLLLSTFPSIGMEVVYPVVNFLAQHAEEMIDTARGLFSVANSFPDVPDVVRRPPSPVNERQGHGNDSLNMNESLRLVQNANENYWHNHGIDIGGTTHLGSSLDKEIAQQMADRSTHVSCADSSIGHRSADSVHHEVANSLDISGIAVDSGQSIVEALLDLADKETPLDMTVNSANENSTHAQDTYEHQGFPDNAFNNGHAREMNDTCQTEDHYEERGNIPIRSFSDLHVLSQKNASALEKFEKVIARSETHEALAMQISASYDELELPREILDVDIKLKLREFFFDRDGRFHAIDSKARQKECLNILYPALKACFAGDKQAFLSYLREKRDQKIPGFNTLVQYEKGNVGLLDYMSYGGAHVGSFFHSFRHKVPKISEIKKGPFIHNLHKIVALTKAHRLEEIKHYVENARFSIDSLNQNSPVLTKDEFLCLSAIGKDILRKADVKAKNVQAEVVEKVTPLVPPQSATVQPEAEAAAAQEPVAVPKEQVSNNEAAQMNAGEVSIQGPPSLTPEDPEKGKERVGVVDKQGKNKEFSECLKNDKEYNDTLGHLEQLKKESPDQKINDRAPRDCDFKQFEKLEKECLDQYEQIRIDEVGINKVMENLKINKEVVQRVKDHVFNNTHKLRDGIGKFDPDINIADAWRRIVDNKFTKTDIEWFLHEFAEAKVEQYFPESTYREIHDYIDTLHNWYSLLR
jgi:hypothetical protein